MFFMFDEKEVQETRDWEFKVFSSSRKNTQELHTQIFRNLTEGQVHEVVYAIMEKKFKKALENDFWSLETKCRIIPIRFSFMGLVSKSTLLAK